MRCPSPPRPLLSVPNVTAHPSTASVPITVLLYNGPLLCGFNAGIKGLTSQKCILLTYRMSTSLSAHYNILISPLIYYFVWRPIRNHYFYPSTRRDWQVEALCSFAYMSINYQTCECDILKMNDVYANWHKRSTGKRTKHQVWVSGRQR